VVRLGSGADAVDAVDAPVVAVEVPGDEIPPAVPVDEVVGLDPPWRRWGVRLGAGWRDDTRELGRGVMSQRRLPAKAGSRRADVDDEARRG
jgi:hypothetical protein